MKHNNRISKYFTDDSPFSDNQIDENIFLDQEKKNETVKSKRIKDCESFNCGSSMEIEE